MFTEDKKVIWGISEKKDGQMRYSVLDYDIGLKSQIKFFTNLGLGDCLVAHPFMCHGNKVIVVDKNNILSEALHNNDGFLTKEKDLILTITIADCLPIYFYDPKREVVGIAHAGWRGAVSNIVGAMIDKMATKFGSNPEDILVYIGPHIKSCHFTIKDDILEKFSTYREFVQENKDQTYNVDLSGIVKSQLVAKKVSNKNITIDSDCTFCHSDKYFSYRRDKPAIVEVMVAYVGMK